MSNIDGIHINWRVLLNTLIEDCVDGGSDNLSGCLLDWSSDVLMLA